MNRLVMNYLVLQGHREAAESFAGESATCVGAGCRDCRSPAQDPRGRALG